MNCNIYIKQSIKTWTAHLNTVKPVNKGHPRERQHMVFIDKWSLFGGYIILFNQGMVTEVWLLFWGGLQHRFDCSLKINMKDIKFVRLIKFYTMACWKVTNLYNGLQESKLIVKIWHTNTFILWQISLKYKQVKQEYCQLSTSLIKVQNRKWYRNQMRILPYDILNYQ